MPEPVLPRGERTQLEILQAAHRLFLDAGFHGTSMRQIAQEAGVAVSGIYNHFPCKEDIFVAVLEAFHPYHEMLSVIDANQDKDIENFVRDAAAQMVAILEKNPGFLNLLLIEIVEFKACHVPRLFEVIFPQVVELTGRFTKRAGYLRPIPTQVIVRAFLGLFFSYYVTGELLGRQFPAVMMENAQDYFVDIFLHGIVAPV